MKFVFVDQIGFALVIMTFCLKHILLLVLDTCGNWKLQSAMLCHTKNKKKTELLDIFKNGKSIKIDKIKHYKSRWVKVVL